jgi:hypothetical protein
MTEAAPAALLATLRPQFRVRMVAIVSIWNDLLLPVQFPGLWARLTVGGRSDQDQAAAFAAGLSKVTRGFHQYGLAADFALIDTKQTPQTSDDVFIVDGSHPAYAACGNIAGSFGCHYPIYLEPGKPDADHVEYHPGFTLSQIIAADASGRDLFS